MIDGMSEYERRAWDKLVDDERARRRGWRARASTKAAEMASSTGEFVKHIPGVSRVDVVLEEHIKAALGGAATAVFAPAVSTVSYERRVRRLHAKHPEVDEASLFEVLDLRVLDKGRPRQILPIAGAVESAGASLVITGLEVSTTVTGGASAAAIGLAIASDIAASLALLGRAIAEVAVHYGYDPAEPEEEVFLLGALSYSTATSLQAKTASLAGLARLSQQMMRRATWKDLEKEVLVKIVQAVFEKVGVNLTHKRLAQLVPVLGGLFSAALSYEMLDRALKDATRVYRVRYLAEKHGVSFQSWVDDVERGGEEGAAWSGAHEDEDELAVDVAEIAEEAIEAAEDSEDPEDPEHSEDRPQ
ncbi:EcsC family protein [Curtobacterium sp. MCPF17_031]|uniref:EcsC family protein n=1 Tax=Curtobacterium sp. MCPF17_031 TaxID=2175653 RepID=UPI000DA8D14D|nr:EcsC family protein [Curtobacterium sp. MCPF17_031]PZE34250.1 hypothetical protein DEJ31_15255 [Curtobacterium sp. MCPF17_031]